MNIPVKIEISYPYLPENREILYVPECNQFIQAAKSELQNSGCVKHPTGAVIVKGGIIIGRGSNAGIKVNECPRWNSPTGKDYEHCKIICKQTGHAEVTAIQNAISEGYNTAGADLYLFGHWWCCKNCWDRIMQAKIKNVYLLYNSWDLFNPDVNITMKEWGKPKN